MGEFRVVQPIAVGIFSGETRVFFLVNKKNLSLPNTFESSTPISPGLLSMVWKDFVICKSLYILRFITAGSVS